MKALVISGGGCMGAFAGGVAEYLITEKHRDYRLFVGSSTGALLLPLLALGEIEHIRKIYSSIEHSDIFDVNPIGFSKMEETYKIKISYLVLLSRILTEKRTFGESRNLRKLIQRSLTKELYKRLQTSGKEVVVAVSNLCCEKLEYKSSNDCGYEDFCDWLWASANMIPFMSLMQKDGCFYADGGLGVGVPIHEAVRRGAKDIDAIVLQLKGEPQQRKKIRNIIEMSSAAAHFMVHQISRNNLLIADFDMKTHVKIKEWFLPRQLTDNELVFNSKEMKAWWREGLEHAREKDKGAGN